jgi:hypothetical protein
MAGIRQTAAFEYASSDKVQTEFENIIRYLQQAEVGSKTLGEVIDNLTDADGNLATDISFQLDSAAGLQYRVGTTGSYTTIAALSALRGDAGQNVGDIGAPIFNTRQDYIIGTTIQASTGVAYPTNTTVLEYSHEATDTLVVFKNGLLQVEGQSNDYTTSPTGNTVTFTAALTTTAPDSVTVYKIRATAITSFQRSDFDLTASQSVFSFTMDANTEIQVYRNGLLQRESASGTVNDYVRDNSNNTVTFTNAVTSGELVSIITVENTTNQVVAGLMLEQVFTNAQTGKILFDKLELADNAIAQAKVNGLTTSLSGKAGLSDVTAGGTALSAGPTNTFYLEDVSGSPRLRFKVSSTQNVDINPAVDIPSPSSANGGKFIRVSAAGAYELSALTDVLSGYITSAQKDAANGVPSLDSNLLISIDRIPAFSVLQQYPMLMMDAQVAAPTTNEVRMKRISGARIKIKKIHAVLDAGTLTLDVNVAGVGQSLAIAVSSTPVAIVPTSDIIIDARTGPISIGIIASNLSSPTVPDNLEVVIEADYVSAT